MYEFVKYTCMLLNIIHLEAYKKIFRMEYLLIMNTNFYFNGALIKLKLTFTTNTSVPGTINSNHVNLEKKIN